MCAAVCAAVSEVAIFAIAVAWYLSSTTELGGDSDFGTLAGNEWAYTENDKQQYSINHKSTNQLPSVFKMVQKDLDLRRVRHPCSG